MPRQHDPGGVTTSIPVLPDEPLTLPRAATPAPRPPLPLLTAIVPVAGAVVLWAVTGSVYALWFALLGPLIAVASIADGARNSRRLRRRDTAEAARAIDRTRREVARRHDVEREERWTRHPDVLGYLRHPAAIWRAVPEREGVLVVGAGDGRSEVRISGGEGDQQAIDVRRDAARIARVPVLVPMTAGVAVIGPQPFAAAVARGLALQACLCLAPGRVRLGDEGPSWADAAPHRHAATGHLLQLSEDGGLVGADVDIPIVVVAEGAPPPPRCAAVLRLTGPARARLDIDGRTHDVDVEPISLGQAVQAANMLTTRAESALGHRAGEAPLPLDDLIRLAPAPRPDALVASFASVTAEALAVDLVRDGPHAVVIGVTGSGKSELLTSWVVSLCARHTPQQVAFLLVDFKGGRTFDHLLPLPHVTGVLTDLDEAAAVRAIESLRAEVRHRERVLGGLGARDVAEAGDALGRLVIVVDEYAALVAAQPGLHDLFGDLAARGRALGIHLVLSAQRAAGVFRDAVLANAPLRIALRVTDAADSRAVLGVDDASRLSGRPHARGVALIRRAGDTVPQAAQVARCEGGTIEEIVGRGGDPARRPWLPALPRRIDLDGIRRADAVVLGIADEPELQRQSPVGWHPADTSLAVIGGPSSGRSSVLRTIADQTGAVVIPSDAEGAWDGITRLADLPAGSTVVVDDLDALVARLPGEYGAQVLDALESAVRGGRARGIRVCVSAQRLHGGVARLIEGMHRRVILGFASRADHVAAGGEASDHVADLPVGRGRIGRTLVQFAVASDEATVRSAGAGSVLSWQPGRRAAAVVLPAGRRSRRLVAQWESWGVEVATVEGATELRRGTVLVGPPDAWLAQWRLLAQARAEADLIVDAACAAEYRALVGARDLPPFALPGADRAWWNAPDRMPRRIVLAAD